MFDRWQCLHLSEAVVGVLQLSEALLPLLCGTPQLLHVMRQHLVHHVHGCQLCTTHTTPALQASDIMASGAFREGEECGERGRERERERERE